MGRWDRFFEAKKQTAAEWLSEEVVNELSRDLSGWPPPILRWNDEAARERYALALAPGQPRPGLAILRTAIQLAVWELEREFEALDAFARHDRAAAVAATPRDRQCLDLLHQWLTDVSLEILEASVLRRPDLILCLQRLGARLEAGLN